MRATTSAAMMGPLNTFLLKFPRLIATIGLALVATLASGAPADEAQVEALSARSTQHDRRLDSADRVLREHTEELRSIRNRYEGWMLGHEARLRVIDERLRQMDARLNRIDQGFNSTAARVEQGEKRVEQGEKRVDGAIDQLREQQVGTEQRLVDLLTNRTVGIAAAILAILLAGVGGLFFVRHSLRAAQSGLGARAELALTSIRSAEERLAQADTRLVEALTQQLMRIREGAEGGSPNSGLQGAQSADRAPNGAANVAAKSTPGSMPATGAASSQLQQPPVDHTLAIRLADELYRMRRRLASLPEETRGIVSLRRSIERLETELADHGYDLVDATGRPYVDGLTMEARFIPDDALAPGQRVISKVIAPQVNYRGALVRMAEVEVGLGG
jgi:hypothetical protein